MTRKSEVILCTATRNCLPCRATVVTRKRRMSLRPNLCHSRTNIWGAYQAKDLDEAPFYTNDIKFHRLHYRTGCLFQSESERMRPMSVLVVFRTILPHTRLATVSRQRFSFSSLTYNRRPASRGRSFGEEISMPSALASRLV